MLIALSVYCYYKFVIPKIKHKKQNNIPNESGNNIVYVYFFNVSWCPHCVNAKPVWTKFCDKFNGKEMNGCVINCVGSYEGTDCTETEKPEISEMIQNFNIEHYPTIKIVKDTNTIEFDAKITYENLEKFANAILNE
jgi:thiol-disulfide isomerase/thioredoxin